VRLALTMPEVVRQLRERLGGIVELGLADRPIELAAADGPPKRIQLAFEGQWVTHPSGKFALDEAKFRQMIANVEAAGVDPYLDREHEGVFSFFDAAAPARGWITGLAIDPHPADSSRKALFGDVDWTAEGADDVVSRRFRYVSGGFLLKARDRQTGKDIGSVLHHGSIVKSPYLQGMQPLSNSGLGLGRGSSERSPMDVFKAFLCALLGLPVDAEDEAVMAAASGKKALIEAALSGKGGAFLSGEALARLGLSSSATGEDVSRKVVSLADDAKGAAALADRIKALENKTIEQEVDAAIAAFKYTPAERTYQFELAKENPDRWRAHTADRPALPLGEQIRTAERARSSSKTEAQQKAIQTWLKDHPGSEFAHALVACATADPVLFDDISQEG
jgi:phage I-like protein